MPSIQARPWRVAEFVVHYVYLGTMFLNGGLVLWLPRVRQLPYDQYRALLLSLVGSIALTFPIAYWVYRKFVAPAALEHIRRATGEGAACSAFKVGTIVITCLGDFSGIAGASLFTYTRDPNGLVIFLASWAVMYGLTSLWAAKGRAYFQRIALSQTAPSKSDALGVANG